MLRGVEIWLIVLRWEEFGIMLFFETLVVGVGFHIVVCYNYNL